MTLIALAMLAAMPLTAQTDNAVAQPTAAAQDQKKICRASTTTGSRLGKRKRCLTEAQWRDEDSRNQADVDRARTISRQQ